MAKSARSTSPGTRKRPAPEVQDVGEITKPSAADAPAAGPLILERRVRIEERDRAKVSWLWKPFPRPVPRAFDRETCITEAKRWFTSDGSEGRLRTHLVELPEVLSREEAWFWIQAWEAGSSRSRRYPLSLLAREIETAQDWEAILRAETAAPIPSDISTLPGVSDLIDASGQMHQLLRALIHFFPPEELANRMIDAEVGIVEWRQSRPSNPKSESMHMALADCSLIYESRETRERFRQAMSARYHAEGDPKSVAAILALNFLSTIRGGADLESYLKMPGIYLDARSSLDLHSLTGLRDEEQLVRAMRKLGNPLTARSMHLPEHVMERARLWLAATEWRQLDFITRTIVYYGAKPFATKLARLLAEVEAPEAALAMLDVELDSKVPAVALEWFARHPLHMTVGLTPVAMGKGKPAEAARKHLHQLRRKGLTDVLLAALPHLPENEGDWLRKEVIGRAENTPEEVSADEMPAALAGALARQKPVKAPLWLQPESLPPIRIAGKKLTLPDVGRVLAALKAAPIPSTLRGTASAKTVDAAEGEQTEVPGAFPVSLVTLLKEHADALSLDAFAWCLFEQWLCMAGPSKDKWAFGAVGHLGGDTSVMKLTPRVRNWPGENQHQRAVFGLDVLRAIATDTALMSLNRIAQTVKFRPLRQQAQIVMEDIAQAQGLTREQLSDRIVPDCGLDARGGRVFDFGPRQFSFVVGPGLEPLLRDASGETKPDLPSPGKADHAEKAAAAVAEWKLLKQTLREVLKVQAARLEDSMITARRWTPGEFQTLLLRHPLMVNLARQLLFGVYDEKGTLTSGFRITEDQSLADVNDDPWELPDSGLIGVVHPAHLEEAVKADWSQIFWDYAIIPPFHQLGREVFSAEPGQLDLTEITGFKGSKLRGIVLCDILEYRSWVKDKPTDEGEFAQHSKFFRAANITAFIRYTGMVGLYYDAPQKIESVYFVPGSVGPDWAGEHANKMLIRNVDPILFSEVVRLALSIMAKAES